VMFAGRKLGNFVNNKPNLNFKKPLKT
jgi:hypothetical protein